MGLVLSLSSSLSPFPSLPLPPFFSSGEKYKLVFFSLCTNFLDISVYEEEQNSLNGICQEEGSLCYMESFVSF